MIGLWLILMLAAITLPVWLPLVCAIVIGVRQCWPLFAVIFLFWLACG